MRDDDDRYDDAEDSPGLSDREAPDLSDMDDRSDDVDISPCPYCNKPVYEGAEVCPHCHSFISSEDAPRRRPWWIWIGLLLGLIGMVSWIV